MKFAVATALTFLVGATLLAGGAMAQDRMRDVKDRPAFTLESGHVDSKNLIGMRVNTPDGKHVGEIDQFLVNARDGKITHAIVGFGGIAGVGESHVVVPWSQVKVQADRDRRDAMVAVIERGALDSAPRYARDGRDRTPAASPGTSPAVERDKSGTPDRTDRAPSNPDRK